MAEFITVGVAGSITSGEALAVEVNDIAISIWNVNGQLFAINDICTHEEAYLSEGDMLDDYCVSCPLHGAEFDVRTGAARCLPATIPVATYPVRIEGNAIQVAV